MPERPSVCGRLAMHAAGKSAYAQGYCGCRRRTRTCYSRSFPNEFNILLAARCRPGVLRQPILPADSLNIPVYRRNLLKKFPYRSTGTESSTTSR